MAQGRLKWYSSDNKELVFGAIQFRSGDVWLVSDLGEQLHIAAVYVHLTQDDQVTESSKSCSLSTLTMGSCILQEPGGYIECFLFGSGH